MYTYAVWPLPVLCAIFVVVVHERRILIPLKICKANNNDSESVR